MGLTLHQKSIYLVIFNATMISRSVGKTFNKDKTKLKNFKKRVFEEIAKLTKLMDKGKLTEDKILDSIENLTKEFKISFGQAQKPINVILKYHFYLTGCKDVKMKATLHCPLDSVILKKLGKSGKSLTKTSKKDYRELQKKIPKEFKHRIDFDNFWDEQNLRDAGIL